MNKTYTAGILLAVSLIFLFARLGHYALWDDEALVALAAKGILRTGDTSALIDHNLVAYREGLLLKDWHDRSTPPLSAYLTAPFLYLFGETAAAARLPFALSGLLSVILILWWLRRDRASTLTWTLMAIALAGNVSFYLFSRQSRYYAPALLFSLAIAYLYLHRQQRSTLFWISLVSVGLIAANPMNYGALYVCLVVDYWIWGRKERPLKGKDWLLLLLPQMVAAAGLLSVWNPFRTGFGEYVFFNRLIDKAVLLWWNFRDLNACEFGVGLFLLASPVIHRFSRENWLLRASVCLVTYIVAVTLVSPQVVSQTSVADVRYLVPVIPLCIFIGVASLRSFRPYASSFIVPVAIIAFGTNLLHGGPLRGGGFRSTILDYARELAAPPSDPYRVTANWINGHVGGRSSVWVVPPHMLYPLMFHSPHPVYAWQLPAEAPPEFSDLPEIHVRGRVPPEYVVAFGPVIERVLPIVRAALEAGITYRMEEQIDHYWRDLHRPELFWRNFKPVRNFDRATEAIYILRSVSNSRTRSSRNEEANGPSFNQ